MMSLDLYKDIHSERDTFVIKPNHQVDTIEDVMKKTATYAVVKKRVRIPEPSDGLNKTSIDNS